MIKSVLFAGISIIVFAVCFSLVQRLGASFIKTVPSTEPVARVAGVEKERAITSEMTARRNAYSSDMNLAQQALAANNLGKARELLYRQRPGVDEPDLRSWEWRYLWQFCQGDALFKLCQKSNAIVSVSVSPDGKWLAIGEEEKGGWCRAVRGYRRGRQAHKERARIQTWRVLAH